MSGFDCKRFADLSEREAKHLSCGICLNIFNTAVDSFCGHTFCRQCIQSWIQNNHKECPECREEFRREISADIQDNSVIIDGNVFNRNLIANAFINEMKINCDFESNGCTEVLQLDLLSQHVKNCKYRFCSLCALTSGTGEEHNCLQLMTSDRNQWKTKFEKLAKYEQSSKTMTERDVDVYEDLLKIVWNRFSLNDYILSEQVLFGTHRMPSLLIDVSAVGIRFEPQTSHQFKVDFEVMQELMYCSDPTFTLIVIKSQPFIGNRIRNILHLEDKTFGWFDVGSEDPTERYIIIDFKTRTLSTNYWMTLKYYSYSNNKELKCEAIVKSKAQDLLYRAIKQ